MDTLIQILIVLVVLMVISLMVAVAGLLAMVRSIRNIRVPRDADFFTTMRFVPLTLVILLDLLDFALDVFSAPVTWIVLDRMGLPNLRNKATIEAIIPATGPIPTFTIAWLLARLFDLGIPPGAWPPSARYPRYVVEDEYHSYPVAEQRRRPSTRIVDMDEP